MEKTTNYQLPQWEASDPLRREDFNQAMANIDTGIAAGAHSYHSLNTYGKAEGETLYTFARAPRAVILFGHYGVVCIGAGSSNVMIDYYAYSSDHKVGFQLSGTSLILTARTNASAASSLKVVALY